MSTARVYNHNRVLVVEDSRESQLMIRSALSDTYDLTMVGSCSEAYQALHNDHYDALLLDINLPDGDGLRVCSFVKSLEKSTRVPVLCVTSKTSIEDKTMGFSLGAVDYITKPFNPLELKLRLDANLRKFQLSEDEKNFIHFDDISLHIPTQKVYIHNGDEKVEVMLSSIEFRLIYFLASHEDFIFSREKLLDQVWGESVSVLDRSVDSCVSKIRHKLGKFGDYIKSVHGVGYKFSTH